MRTEASIEEWGKLYEVATRIGSLRPWEYLWDRDLIGIQTKAAPEDTVFYSILGKGGNCYGVAVYEGYEALNSFMLLTMQEQLNVTPGYAMFNQENLTCYWGSREELSSKQREIIKSLGYKYRGKNNWLYFLSFEPGYYPYNLNQYEVLRMTQHLENLETACLCYQERKTSVDFESGNMFFLKYSGDKKMWESKEAPVPLKGYRFDNTLIDDDQLLKALRRVPKGGGILEADVRPLGISLADKEYDKPANPQMSLLAEATTGTLLANEMNEPYQDPMEELADEVINYILRYGVPEEIRVTNMLVEASLEQICEVCNTKTRRVRKLSSLDKFWEMLMRPYY